MSATAMAADIGDHLAMTPLEAAWGIAEVVDENMANAARVHAVENGEDLSDYTMIAFGGAAPLHAARLCEKLGIERCLVPSGAGVGSAIGFLCAPFSFESNRSVFTRISDFDADRVRQLFTEMEMEARQFVRSCDDRAEIHAEHKVYMRYAGQGWEIPVSLTAGQATAPDAAVFLELFENGYVKLFGRRVAGMEAEITVWSVNAYTVPQRAMETASPSQAAEGVSPGRRPLFDPVSGELTDATVMARREMGAGVIVDGPAVITEEETTVVLPASRSITSLADGCLDIHIRRNKANGIESGSEEVAHV